VSFEQIKGDRRVAGGQSESDEAYRGLLLWSMCLPERRSTFALSRAMGAKENTVRAWSLRYRWEERIGGDPAQCAVAARLYAERFWRSFGTTEIDVLGDRLAHKFLPPDGQQLNHSGRTRQQRYEVEHKEDVENRDYMRNLLRGAISQFAKDLAAGKVKARSLGEIGVLIKASVALEARETLDTSGADGRVALVETVRVQQARASKDPLAVLRAIRDDAAEVLMISEVLLAANDVEGAAAGTTPSLPTPATGDARATG